MSAPVWDRGLGENPGGRRQGRGAARFGLGLLSLVGTPVNSLDFVRLVGTACAVVAALAAGGWWFVTSN